MSAECQRCGGRGVEPSPTGLPQIGAPSCLACGGRRRGVCTEREARAAMTDAEFWDHVLNASRPSDLVLPGWGEGDEALDSDVYPDTPCPVCHSTGACGWDAEGLPLIHAQEAASG